MHTCIAQPQWVKQLSMVVSLVFYEHASLWVVLCDMPWLCVAGFCWWWVGAMVLQGASSGGRDSQGGLARRRHPYYRHRASRGSALHLACRAQTSGLMWPARFWQDHDPLFSSTLSARPRGGGPELLQRYHTRASAQDIWPLLRVPQDSQWHHPVPNPAQQVAGPVLWRDQLARHGQVWWVGDCQGGSMLQDIITWKHSPHYWSFVRKSTRERRIPSPRDSIAK